MGLTVEGCVSSLVEMGYVFSRRDDGVVTVKQPAKRNPRAAEMMAYLALHKEEVRAVVRARDEVQMRIPVAPDVVIDAEAPPDWDQRVINSDLDSPERVDQIRAAVGVTLPEPDADGIVRLVRVPPEVAFLAGDLINDGKAELIGNVIYRRISNVFDVTYRVVEP